ncbi:MAG: alpha-L-fucosidase [Prevotella sp.]|jgi:alpha-L-fucosidase|nr:alpha-L-fucosidase [Prevotella sp.]
MNTSRLISTLLAMFMALQAGVLLHAQEMNEMWSEQDAKATDVRRGRYFDWGNYAMFIHWGLYSQIANQWDGTNYYGIGEWIMHCRMAGIRLDEYKAVAKRFNPVKFDAKAIAQLAKDAGMKYIVITSKHHDGFAMYHSPCNTFNIVDATPFKRDPMKELAEACREAGLGLGFYYSHNQDWTYPGGTNGPKVDSKGEPKTFDNYFFEKCLPQVEEITRNYGEIEIVWFDTPKGMPEKYVRQLVDVVRRNQPAALVSGRVGFNLGDYKSYGDMEVPLENLDGLWEGVDVTNDSWGYAWYDENWKTPKQILSNLISTVARGGTYMLNVGPDGLGEIPKPAQIALRSAGKWIAEYPQIVYSADPSPWRRALPWGDAVINGGKLYLAVYYWPTTGKLCLSGLKSDIASVSLLNGNKKATRLNYSKQDGWTLIETPYRSADPLISVIEITLKGKIDVVSDLFLDPEMGASFSVKFSKPDSCHVISQSWMEKFGEWKHQYQISDWTPQSSASWEFNVKDAGYYMVELTYAGVGRKVWEVETGEGCKIRNQQNSSSIQHTQPIGWIKFDKAGKQTLRVSMPEKEWDNTVLSSVTITPVKF